MGIFNFFKKNNKIELDYDISTEPMYVYHSKKIKLPSTAVVEENMELFFCEGGKILDSFKEGEHLINIATLPLCDKKFKLSKPDADGKLASYFFCHAYYVNKNIFTYKKWKTYRKADISDIKVGQFNVGLSGGYAFKITDTKKFVSVMLKEYDIIKNKEAEKILSGYVGEFVLSYIEKNKIGLDQLLKIEKIVDQIFESINQKLDFLGVEFLGFSIEKVNLPKHLRLTKQNIVQEYEVGENIFDIQARKNINQKLQEKDNQAKDVDELLHFGNQKTTQDNNEKSIYIRQSELNKNNDSSQKNIRCLFCGYENKIDDEKCAICGQTLKRKGKIL